MEGPLFRAILSAVVIGAGAAAWVLAKRSLLRLTRGAAAELEGFVRGRPAIVYFSSPRCAPCRTVQRPAVERVGERLRGRVTVIEVDTLERPEVAERWGVLTVPTTVLVDGAGRAREVNPGLASAEKLAAQAESLLAVALPRQPSSQPR